MYRFLLTPRWFGINLFAVLAVPICLFMGTWQLGRFEDRVETHREAENRPVATAAGAVPVHDVLGGPGAGRTAAMEKGDVGRAVSATGTYDAGRQFLVPERRLDGRRGYYVLTMLRTEPGPALPVVRGWHEGGPPKAAPEPPTGEVSVLGSLQAPESTGTAGVYADSGLPRGQLGVISASSLLNVLPYPVHDAWITLAEGDGGLTAVPPTARQAGGLDLKAFQNLGYTGEWFVFAGFVVFMWFRLFRRDAETERDIASGLAPAPGAEAAVERGPGRTVDPEAEGDPEAAGEPEAGTEPAATAESGPAPPRPADDGALASEEPRPAAARSTKTA